MQSSRQKYYLYAVKSTKTITVSFTGHRDYDNFAEDALRKEICRLHTEGFRHFMCGMARGFDLAAAEMVLSLRPELSDIRLVCVIPFRGQEQSFSKEDRARFERVTSEADEVIVLAERYHAGAYHARNDFLVDNASAIIAYYNGTKGGTHYTIRRAAKRGLQIHNICSYREGELFNDLK